MCDVSSAPACSNPRQGTPRGTHVDVVKSIALLVQDPRKLHRPPAVLDRGRELASILRTLSPRHAVARVGLISTPCSTVGRNLRRTPSPFRRHPCPFPAPVSSPLTRGARGFTLPASKRWRRVRPTPAASPAQAPSATANPRTAFHTESDAALPPNRRQQLSLPRLPASNSPTIPLGSSQLPCAEGLPKRLECRPPARGSAVKEGLARRDEDGEQCKNSHADFWQVNEKPMAGSINDGMTSH